MAANLPKFNQAMVSQQTVTLITASTSKCIYTADADNDRDIYGAKIATNFATNGVPAALTGVLFIDPTDSTDTVSANAVVLGTFAIPLSSGYTTAALIYDLFTSYPTIKSHFDMGGNPVRAIGAGKSLKITLTSASYTTPTGGATINTFGYIKG